MSTLEQILRDGSKNFNNLKKVENKLFKPQLIQLHPNIEGFESPNTFAVYKETGGEPLGVVGKVFKPMDLGLMLDSIVESVRSCSSDLNLDSLDFKEYKGGSKVAFTLDLPKLEIEGSPMVGDIVERKLEFRTGFDGKTKSSVTETFNRLWCSNGCTNTVSQSLAFKNTLNNHKKIYNLCSYIENSLENSQGFVTNLSRLNDISITQKEIDTFVSKVLGYDVKEYESHSKRTRERLDSINQSIAIEMANTGDSLFSLLNGVTRFTTHDMAKGDEGKLFYSSAETLNQKALRLAFSELN